MTEDVSTLKKNIAGLEKANEQLANANEELEAALADMKKSQQIKAWAIDRAIETLKIGRADAINADADLVISFAKEFTNWTLHNDLFCSQNKPGLSAVGAH